MLNNFYQTLQHLKNLDKMNSIN